jgi:hypothetical protein
MLLTAFNLDSRVIVGVNQTPMDTTVLSNPQGIKRYRSVMIGASIKEQSNLVLVELSISGFRHWSIQIQ